MDVKWVEAEGGYALGLDGERLVCRNSKGTVLKSVPSKVRKGQVALELLEVRDWLKEHRAECREQVERWLLRSLPVPRAVVQAIWPDPAWRSVLRYLVVAAYRDGQRDPDRVGLLLDVDAERGCGIVTLDGETEWIAADELALPHPILLEDLEDFRELCGELGYEQGFDQLYRETFTRSASEEKGEATRRDDFGGGKFEEQRFAIGRARSRGFRVSGGYAVCPVHEEGRNVLAQFWIGVADPYEEAVTGELTWTDEDDQAIPISALGPVAFSEGMRMASVIHAGRKLESEESE